MYPLGKYPPEIKNFPYLEISRAYKLDWLDGNDTLEIVLNEDELII